MIRFTNAGDGTTVTINPARIFTVRETAAGTAILSAGGDTVYVKQSLKEVGKRLDSAAVESGAGTAAAPMSKPVVPEPTVPEPIAEPLKPTARPRAKKA